MQIFISTSPQIPLKFILKFEMGEFTNKFILGTRGTLKFNTVNNITEKGI